MASTAGGSILRQCMRLRAPMHVSSMASNQSALRWAHPMQSFNALLDIMQAESPVLQALNRNARKPKKVRAFWLSLSLIVFISFI